MTRIWSRSFCMLDLEISERNERQHIDNFEIWWKYARNQWTSVIESSIQIIYGQFKFSRANFLITNCSSVRRATHWEWILILAQNISRVNSFCESTFGFQHQKNGAQCPNSDEWFEYLHTHFYWKRSSTNLIDNELESAPDLMEFFEHWNNLCIWFWAITNIHHK